MNPTIAAARREAAAASISQLRTRLLDLTARNPLINFDHNSRTSSRLNVRAVDGGLDDIFRHLTTPQAMPVRPLPPMPTGPSDEATPSFQSALDLAKRTDSAYAAAMDALTPEEAATVRAAKIERKLRDEVRKDLGMPPAKELAVRGLAEHATQNGIDPSFDLAASRLRASQNGRGEAIQIRALLLPEQLERRLSKIRDSARVTAEETGVSTLYTAFGFLEWFESDSSDRSFTSPLLLLRTDLHRAMLKSHYQYSIEEAGEDVQVNLTLAERLGRDFRLGLPRWSEDDSPVAYLTRVEQEVCKDRPRWRVRHWMTLAQFPFARLAMFEDLDEAQWRSSGGLSTHPVLGELLGGVENAGEMFAQEHDVDSAEVSAKVPTLIMEADGSQHSAIYDAISGRNLVIEGPPGTGKSQTISNLIAAALATGKRVLFVADKQTALQVVKDRLDKAGLGDFCLEIHSGKARKKDVIESLNQRLQRRPTSAAIGLDRKREEISNLKAQLTRYVTLLNSPFGAEQRTIHDLIWADRRRRQVETPEARRLDDVILPRAEQLSDIHVGKLKALLNRFEKAAEPIRARAPTLHQHPWHGVTRAGLPPTDLEIAQREIGDLHQQLVELRERASVLYDMGVPTEASLLQMTVLARTLADITIASGHSSDWHFALLDPRLRAEVTEWLRSADSFVVLASKVEALGFDVRNLPSSEAISSFLSTIPPFDGILPHHLSITGLTNFVEVLLSQVASADALVNAAIRVLPTFGVQHEITVADLAKMIEIVDLFHDTEDAVLAFAIPPLLERDALDAIEAAAARLKILRRKQAEITSEFDVDKAPGPEELRRHAETLRSSGMFSFLSPSAKEAQRTHANLRKGSAKASKTQAADDLERLAEFLAVATNLREDTGLRTIFGKRFKGFDTDEVLAAACARLGDRVRAILTGYDGVTLDVRAAVLGADEDRRRAIAALRSRVVTSDLREHLKRVDASVTLSASTSGEIRERAKMLSAYVAAGASLALPPDLPVSQHERVVQMLAELVEAARKAQHPASFTSVCREPLPDVLDDLSPLRAAIAASSFISELSVPSEVRSAVAKMTPEHVMHQLVPAARAIVDAIKRLVVLWDAAKVRLGLVSDTFFSGEFLDLPIERLAERLEHANAFRDDLGAWIAFLVEREEAELMGLSGMLRLWDEGLISGRLADALERVFHRSLTREAYAHYPELRRFSGVEQEDVQGRFKSLDAELAVASRKALVSTLLSRPIPPGVSVGRRSEYTQLAVIENEIAKRTKHIPIRSLLDRAGAAIQAMKPCFMMSPISVAQYIKPGGIDFDLLVIDEASQMRPEDAIGAIARCKQMVVVGDPKQLAPTGFFDGGGAADLDDEEAADDQIDVESVLDQAMARFRPARRLRWHYRSRHGSLIAFSNKEFYDNDLIVLPSPALTVEGQGVSSCKVDGTYKSRSNQIEARAVCDAVVDHMRRWPERSLGVATLNAVQRQLIQEELDQIATSDPDVQAYLERWNEGLERFFVKNLENVQGDERDSVFVSTVFGPSEDGKVRHNFGPINGKEGHRRLNVLFTRAKHQLRVFTSMTPDQIQAGPESSRGARVLRDFLTYASTGRLEAGVETGREADSDFEIFVRDRLVQAGYDCVPQVGVSGFFLDLAVRDPARPDVFLLGVECDGASYHSSKSARDRDILRQQILEGLGWKIYRVWSTDWFRDPNGQTAKLVAHIESLRAEIGRSGTVSSRVFA